MILKVRRENSEGFRPGLQPTTLGFIINIISKKSSLKKAPIPLLRWVRIKKEEPVGLFEVIQDRFVPLLARLYSFRNEYLKIPCGTVIESAFDILSSRSILDLMTDEDSPGHDLPLEGMTRAPPSLRDVKPLPDLFRLHGGGEDRGVLQEEPFLLHGLHQPRQGAWCPQEGLQDEGEAPLARCRPRPT